MNLRPAERDALRPPEEITVSEWAERHRILDGLNCPEPGPWSNDRAPWLIGIMDAWTDPDVEEITVQKGTQLGVTEAALNCVGYCLDQDPGPLMYVMPRRADRDYLSARRFEPMVAEAPVLRDQITGRRGDEKSHERAFSRMLIYFSAAQSPTDMSSRPCRYVIMDEVDRYPIWSGKEGDPLELARGRTDRFWNRKILKLSSPTLESGYIHQEFQRSDRRYFLIPCPHCGKFQKLVFDQIKLIGEDRDPAVIRSQQRARYECVECGREITEPQKSRACLAGEWVQEQATISRAGRIKGEKPNRHRGFQISGLYWSAPWDILATFFEAQEGGPQKLQPFVNGRLGEVWTEKVKETTTAQLARLALDYERGTVPPDVRLITVGVDVQMDYFVYTVRGWGYDLESWLIEADTVNTWEELIRCTLRQTWDGRLADSVAIDSGYRTWEVYELCLSWAPVAIPVKGDNRPKSGLPFRTANIEKNPATGQAFRGGLTLWHVNTGLFKDRIARLQTVEQGEPGGWHLHKDPDRRYLEQLVAERRVLQVDKQGRSFWLWRKRYHRAPNHYWDAEVYAAAAAHIIGAHTLRSDQIPADQARERRARQKRRRGRGEFSGWGDAVR